MKNIDKKNQPGLVAQVSNRMNACDWYRAYLPIKQLDRESALSTVKIVNSFNLLTSFTSDIISTYRPKTVDVLGIIEPSRWMGSEVIADFDDDVLSIPASNYCAPNFGPTQMRTSAAICGKVFHLSTSTPRLASKLRQYNDNVTVIPNTIDWDLVTRILNTRGAMEGNNIVKPNHFHIVWAGTVTHVEDIMVVLEPLRELMKKYSDIKVTFFGFGYNKFMEDFVGRVAYQPMVELFYYQKLLMDMKPDLIIQPLMDHVFNYSKSNIRWLEASAFQIPCIASDTPAFKDLGDDFCLTCGYNTSDWYEKMEHLYLNQDVGKAMGIRSQEIVRKYWSIQSMWRAWRDYYYSVWRREPFKKDFTPDMKEIYKNERFNLNKLVKKGLGKV